MTTNRFARMVGEKPSPRMMAACHEKVRALAEVVSEHPEGITLRAAHAELVSRHGRKTWAQVSSIQTLATNGGGSFARYGIRYQAQGPRVPALLYPREVAS